MATISEDIAGLDTTWSAFPAVKIAYLPAPPLRL
jgi:hypothetical protein